MRGPFGGELIEGGAGAGSAREPLPRELLEALDAGARASELPDANGVGAAIVGYDVDVAAGHVTYTANVGETRPIDEAPALTRASVLAALADVAAALRAIHSTGAAHGDVRPATVRMGSAGPVLLVPAKRLAAGASLVARLRHGVADAAEVAYAAPEVATRFEVTDAADVYALAAVTHRVLTGFAPLGQVDFSPALRGPMGALASHVAAALAASPAARPSIVALERALRAAAGIAAEIDAAPAGGPYRAEPSIPRDAAASPAQAAAMHAGASSMSAILVLVLVVGGFFVLVGAVWLVAVNWDALGEVGRFAVLAAVTLGVAASGFAAERRGYARSGFALVVVASQLLWADAAYLLHLLHAMDKPGPWTLASGAVTAVTFALATKRKSALAATLAALGFAICATCLGVYLESGVATGPATYMLFVALAFAGMTALAHALARERVGAPFALGAILAAWSSALLGLVLLADEPHRAFGTGFPYVVLALSVPFTLFGPQAYRTFALVAVSGLVVSVPAVEALVQHDALAYLAVAVALGLALVGASFGARWLARDAGRQHAGIVFGLVSAVGPASILFVAKCADRDGLELIRRPEGVYLLLVCAVPTALLALSYAVSSRAPRKSAYRLVELVALLQFFGIFTFESLLRYDDFFYPVVLLGAAVCVLAAGVATRRATLVMIASSALLINLWIQYFEKLRHAFPMSVLVLGFGIGLLAFGVLYERRVRHLLPKMVSWA